MSQIVYLVLNAVWLTSLWSHATEASETACDGSTPEDCAEIKIANPSAQTGVHTIKLKDGSCDGVLGTEAIGKCCVDVYCDMDRFGGGWTVFQKRFNGSVNFNNSWAEYEVGFGSPNGEFYAGNKFIYYFAGRKTYELLVELDQKAEMCKLYARYSSFSLTNTVYYNLSVGDYTQGTAGDGLRYHNSMGFSAPDRDNDAHWGHCAQALKGGWWFRACHSSNLNGLYQVGCTGTHGTTINWGFRGYYYSFKASEMKLRPANYSVNDPEENLGLCHADYSPVRCDYDVPDSVTKQGGVSPQRLLSSHVIPILIMVDNVVKYVS